MISAERLSTSYSHQQCNSRYAELYCTKIEVVKQYFSNSTPRDHVWIASDDHAEKATLQLRSQKLPVCRLLRFLRLTLADVRRRAWLEKAPLANDYLINIIFFAETKGPASSR